MTGVRFNPTAFNRHLRNIGQRLEWRRAFACACVNPDSGAADPKHQACAGKGWLWAKPVATVCGVSQQKISPELIAAGLFENGDLTLTIPADSPMWSGAGRFDRVRLLNATSVFSQPLKRGHVSERLLFAVQSITRCFWLNPATREIVDGGIPLVSDDGTLSWPNGGEPLPGTPYSLTGTKYEEYFVLDNLPSNRNEHSGMALPKRLQLRKWDMFGR